MPGARLGLGLNAKRPPSTSTPPPDPYARKLEDGTARVEEDGTTARRLEEAP